jgi:hypothetical protein
LYSSTSSFQKEIIYSFIAQTSSPCSVEHQRTGAAQARREIARTFSSKGNKGKSTKAKIEGRRRGVPQSECMMSLQFFISSDINLPVAIKMYLSNAKLH